MAKQLTVQHQGKDLHFDLDKVDRTKLYGYIDTEVLDEQGQLCELATLNSDGNTLVGRGGTALAMLSPDGLWRERSALKAVDPQGQLITPVKSSFDEPIPLDKTASIDDYLWHNINLVYKLETEDDVADLVEELRRDDLYFPLQLPRRVGSLQRVPLAGQRRQPVPYRRQHAQDRVCRPGATRRHGRG